LVGRWGQPDADELLGLVDELVADGVADPKRIGVLGLSYGGLMVLSLIARHPRRFAAAVCENPVSDFVSFVGASDLGWFIGKRGAGFADAPMDLPAIVEGSPWTRLDAVRVPLLLLQSDDDLRCPPVQTDLVFQILRSRGRTVEMVRYPEESHYLMGFGRPDRRSDRIQRIVDWFEHNL
jgi:dipeptidyl aminopeptidase/acylaminoacyl peptidase